MSSGHFLRLVAQIFIFSHFLKTAPVGNAGSASVESMKGLHKASRTGSGSALRTRSPSGFTPNQLCDLQQVTELLSSSEALPPRWDIINVKPNMRDTITNSRTR